MNQTERLLTEIKALLLECTRTKKLSSMGSLQDHMRRLQLPHSLKEVGCDELCSACEWGLADAHPMANPCRLAAFQEAIMGMKPGDKLSASLQREAKELLVMLERAPRPHKP